MRIAVDVREACRNQRTGKGQWTHGFVSELLSREHDLILCSDVPLPEEWSKAHTYVQTVRGARWHFAMAKSLLHGNIGADAYLSPTSTIVPFLVAGKFPTIPVVHDLIAFRPEPHDWKATLIERLTLGKAVRFASTILTVSESTKRDLLDRYPTIDSARVIAVHAGPSFLDVRAMEHPERIILSIGTLSPRKNQRRLVEAFQAVSPGIREGWKLLLVGKRGWGDRDILEAVAQSTAVEWKQYLDDAACADLLRRSTIVAYPSLYEGFGIPVLDAMRCGVPVLTSSTSSLPEVAGDAAEYVDPVSVGSITKGLERLMVDVRLRESLRERGFAQSKRFTWKNSVDRFLETLLPPSKGGALLKP